MFDSNASTLADALAACARANAMMAAVDLEAESDRSLLDAAVRVQEEKNRLEGQQLRVIEAVDRRGAVGLDGAVTTASWFRSRTRQAPGEVTQQVKAAQRLRDLPKLRDALESGLITYRHVTAVTHHAIPRRLHHIAPLDPLLREIAIESTPAEVEQIVNDIGAAFDPDGSDAAPLAETGRTSGGRSPCTTASTGSASSPPPSTRSTPKRCAPC